ncbi:hypothetical protein GCM10009798_40980 [Nocardioides panacihumi]|uniref:DUF4190 domain-containing protein n=1 Tax=Nocardioides panacihumi TaxID=400774 RepID=A0ABN2RVD5_9ACTN
MGGERDDGPRSRSFLAGIKPYPAPGRPEQPDPSYKDGGPTGMWVSIAIAVVVGMILAVFIPFIIYFPG